MLYCISQLLKIFTSLGYAIESRARIYQDSPLRHERQIQLCAQYTTPRHSIDFYESHGILTVYPSGAAFAIPLGPTNPWLIYIAKETLIFRRAGISPALRLLVPTFLLRNAPVWVTPSPSSRCKYSPTTPRFAQKLQTPIINNQKLEWSLIIGSWLLVILCEARSPQFRYDILAPIICGAKFLDE